MRTSAARLCVALVLAALLAQPMGALADDINGQPPPDPAGTTVTAGTAAVNAGLQDTGVSLSVRVPFPGPGKVLPPGNIPAVQKYTPKVPDPCSASYSAGITLGPVEVGIHAGTRLATWTNVPDYIKSTSWMMLSPTITPANAAVMGGDGSIYLPTHLSVAPGMISLPMLDTNIAQSGYRIDYTMSGTFQPSVATDPNSPLTCMIDHYTSPHSTPWCTNLFQGGTCSLPITVPTPGPNPVCAGAGCVPAISSIPALGLPALITRAKNAFTTGGTVVATPNAGRELVTLPATFSLVGGPADTPTQDLTLQVALPGSNIGVVSYEIKIGYTGTDWLFDDVSSIGPYPAEHRTNMSFNCGRAPQCITTQPAFDWIGHWNVRAIDNFSITYRELYYWNYPSGFYDSGWQDFPGGTFTLCTAGESGPNCGPGTKAVWGQVEAIPVGPPSYPVSP